MRVVFLVVALLPFFAAATGALTGFTIKDQADVALTWSTPFANCVRTYSWKSFAAATTGIKITATFGAGTVTYSLNSATPVAMVTAVQAAATLTIPLATTPSKVTSKLEIISDTDGIYTFTFERDGLAGTITALELTDSAGTAVTVTPAWASGKVQPDVTSWATVGSTITGIKFKATFATGTASVALGTATAVPLTTATISAEQTIAVGVNQFIILGGNGESYYIYVYKAGSVSALAFTDQADGAITLDTAFIAGKASYSAMLADSVTSLKITATFTNTLKAKFGTLAEQDLVTAVAKVDTTNFATTAQIATAPTTTVVTLTAGAAPLTYTVTFTKKATVAISAISLKDDTGAVVTLAPTWARATMEYTGNGVAVAAKRIKPTITFATGVTVMTWVQPSCSKAQTPVSATSATEFDNAVNDLTEATGVLGISTSNGDGVYLITLKKGGSSSASSTSFSVVALVLSVVLSVVAIWA